MTGQSLPLSQFSTNPMRRYRSSMTNSQSNISPRTRFWIYFGAAVGSIGILGALLWGVDKGTCLWVVCGVLAGVLLVLREVLGAFAVDETFVEWKSGVEKGVAFCSLFAVVFGIPAIAAAIV